jgi:four helix bundle protein
MMGNGHGRFRDLRVWSEGVELARAIYKLTATFPFEEKFGLTAQLRRAAVSVPSNIAEGSVRHSRRDFCRFLEISLGSLAEIETQLEIADDMGRNCSLRTDVDERVARVRKMLFSLHNSLKSHCKPSQDSL